MFSKDELVEQCPTFFEYLDYGLNLNFHVAIDFTQSNGSPNDVSSLHYHRTDLPSIYAKALSAVGGVVEYYDTDKKVPVWGFGGKQQMGPVQHRFPLNGSEEYPEADGIEGVLALYAQVLQVVRLSGPTYFAPVISHVGQMTARLQPPPVLQYTVFLIITNGQINDMEATKDEIVAAALLPMSIIILGVGSADFSSMILLDGDHERITSSQGIPAVRDIVQFAEYSRWQNDVHELAREVLS